MRRTWILASLLFGSGMATALAEPLKCSMEGYQALAGLTATGADEGITVSWEGERSEELRLRFALTNGVPTIRELAVRRKGAAWSTLAAGVVPEFRVVSGLRRMSNQQMVPLRELGVSITPEVIEKHKWDAFWDAPLDPGATPTRSTNPPPREGIAGQPGLPRNPSEIQRVTATYASKDCQVRTNGSRLEVSFPGMTLGVFTGRLQFTVYKGSNLIRQEMIGTTREPSVAYKYEAGLRGLATRGTRMAWRDIANTWQSYQFGGAIHDREVPLRSSNRLLIAEQDRAGSIATFPPPHSFFWARELSTNLGYTWYRKDSETSFSFGIRQAEAEEGEEFDANFALYSARPGTEQRMPVYFYARPDSAAATLESVLAYTHGDRYKPLPGYQVMNHHYHMDLGQRLLEEGNLNGEIADLHALKALGINIVSPIDSVFAGPAAAGRPRPDPLVIAEASFEGAKRHSDKDFLVMANQEFYGSPLGGHTDLLFSRPVYWTSGRSAGQPLSENHSKFGKVYHIGNADDLMEMARRENILISMPHPRTKGSTGFPDAVKDSAAFRDPHYQGVGYRWGMGLDGSERRLCEFRCLPLLDDMSNWVADLPIPPKYILSISEARHQQPGDDIYSSSPVSYVRLNTLPSPDDVSPVIQALMRGDYFVTSGEVLIPSFSVQGSGNARTITAEVEWTFPLEFVEVVWGDGKTTDRQIISATNLAPMGRQRFQIPLDVTGKKWVRFAAWDSAGNGALVQPVKLSSPGSTSNGRAEP